MTHVMGTASIPVDLLNPGQVFACLGFLEVADILLGNAEAAFDWSDDDDVRFHLRAVGDDNPFRVVLGFFGAARLEWLVPKSYDELSPSNAEPKATDGTTDQDNGAEEAGNDDSVTEDGPLCAVETFPARTADRTTLPVRLTRQANGSCQHLDVTHWCDASSRNDFKLFAGQLRGPVIARAMLKEIADLQAKCPEELVADPFGLTVPMSGSSFKFDARRSWTGIDAGYSPDEQNHRVAASPVVEMLAAVGLEHARPDEFATREVRYGVWGDLLPPTLARPALAGIPLGIPIRTFRFTLDLSGKNKVVTFAQEETHE